MDNESLVTLENVSKIYMQGHVEVKAVDRLDLQIEKGEFSALSGPSGSGKTTILNMIGALDEPSEGAVYLEGKNLRELSRSRLSGSRGSARSSGLNPVPWSVTAILTRSFVISTCIRTFFFGSLLFPCTMAFPTASVTAMERLSCLSSDSPIFLAMSLDSFSMVVSSSRLLGMVTVSFSFFFLLAKSDP